MATIHLAMAGGHPCMYIYRNHKYVSRYMVMAPEFQPTYTDPTATYLLTYLPTYPDKTVAYSSWLVCL